VALIRAGYDRDFTAELSEPARPLAVRAVSGWRALELDRDRNRVRVPRGVRLDLGATAKALAADRAVHAATRGGLGALVNLGGDIAMGGPPPSPGWTVHVTDDHRDGPAARGQTVCLQSGGLATSSTTVRRWGTRSHHVVDPATGLPAGSPWRTASVAAATCVDANIASTAAIVRGADALDWLAANKLPARLVDHTGEVVMVAGWPAEVHA